jgi:2',3'-cyclic-nucleotide 2'-phosphodiesterase (5'-nucleotidase family)
MNPTGGLPRRKSALAQLTLKGPTLAFDSGNALFALEGKGQLELEPRARFILQTMAKLGVKVMAAGAKDLGPGASWLKAEAVKAGVQIVSANLEENGKRVFEGSTVITAGGVRVGFIGLSPPGETVGNTPMTAGPILPAVKAELQKLKGKTDLVIVLAAVHQPDAFEIAKAFKSEVDFVIRSGDQQGNIPAQRIDDSAWVMTGGQRGQSVVQAVLKLDGKGAFIDLSEVAREKELLASLDVKIKEFEPRVKAAKDPESKKLMETTMKELQARRAEQKKKVDPGVSPTARTFDLNYAVLDASVVDEPSLKTEVLKYEPTYAGAH